jgi:hypothetical protein
MTIARRRAAARNGLAAILVVLAAIPPAAFAGEGGQNFVLPLVTALAVASAAHKVPQQVGVMQPGGRPLVSLIPSQVQFEDGYEIDVNDYIGIHDPVDGIDVDRVASFDMLPHRRKGWMASFVYDTERRGPIESRDDVLRLMLDYRW